MKPFTPHDLRRTSTGEMLDAGVDRGIVRQLMGHANPVTTAQYERRDERTRMDAARRIHIPMTGRYRLDYPSWIPCDEALFPAANRHAPARLSIGDHRTMKNKGMFVVMAKVGPGQEEAFNRWYDEDHMPKALNRFPGVISGRRYKIMDGGDGYNYMALYEFENEDRLNETMKSGALQGLIQEFDAAFGDVTRKRMLATEIKSFITG